jgi:hypothetical protein
LLGMYHRWESWLPLTRSRNSLMASPLENLYVH